MMNSRPVMVYLSWQVDVQVIVTENAENDIEKLEYQRPAYVAVGLIMAMTATSILFPLIVTSRVFGLEASLWHKTVQPCADPCRWVKSAKAFIVFFYCAVAFLTWRGWWGDWYKTPSHCWAIFILFYFRVFWEMEKYCFMYIFSVY